MSNRIVALGLTSVLVLLIAPVVAQESSPIEVLNSDASFEAKAEACRALARDGGAEAVAALAPLLRDERLSHMARLALEPMPFPEAGEALREALKTTRGTLQAGIASSLGERRDEQAAPALIALLTAESVVALAAAEALGDIATPEAAEALSAAIGRPDVAAGELRVFCAALLGCAERMAAQGRQAEAAAVYDRLSELKNAPPEVPGAALRGAILTRPGTECISLLTEALRSEDDLLFDAALRVAREMEASDAVTKGIADALSGIAAERKVRVIDVLAYRGGAVTGPALLEAAKSSPDNVRIAALRALARVGYVPALELIEQLLWVEDANVAKAAQDALSYFPGIEGDAILKGMLEKQEVAARRLAIELIGRGGLRQPVELLMHAAQSDTDESVRVAALRAVRNYAGTAQVPALLEVVLATASSAEREAAEGALKALCTRQKSATASAPAPLVDAFALAFQTAGGEAKLAMLRLLGATCSPSALDIVLGATSQQDETLKAAALREVCDWQTFDAFDKVMELATTSNDARVKLLARRGAVRLLRLGQLEAVEQLPHYAALMKQSETADDRKLVLSGLAQVPHVDAFDMVLQQFGDEAVRPEAVQAAIGIAKKLGSAPREDVSIAVSEGLPGWNGNKTFWRFEDSALTGHSAKQVQRSEFIWFNGEVRDFYLAFDVKLEPNTANSGVQFRSQKIDEHGQALGYQADIGQEVWGRLYHEHGRGKLYWNDRAEKAVKPGDWNRYEILASGPAIWTAINGTLGVACVDSAGERAGRIALQLHAGPPQTVRYRFVKLVHDPKIELAGLNAEQLVAELKGPGQE